MKLVNVEDLKVLVAVESEGSIRYGKLVTDLFNDIPIVEAIPVDWIKNHYGSLKIAQMIIEGWENNGKTD